VGFPSTSGVYLETTDGEGLLGLSLETGDGTGMLGFGVEVMGEGVLGLYPCSYWDFNEGSGVVALDQGSEEEDILVQYGDTPPVAYWKFNAGSGTVLADSSQTSPAAPGTITGAPPWEGPGGGVTGAFADSALIFGTTGQVTIEGNPSDLQITGDLTISMWLKPSSISAARQNPYNKAYSGEGTITQETNGTLNFYHGSGGGDGPSGSYQGSNSSSTVTQGVWNHIVVTRDSSNVKWYINGSLTSTTSNAHSSSTSTRNATIGNGYASGYTGVGYRGGIDEAAVFNYALDATQVTAMYGGGTPLDATSGPGSGGANPVAYWRFNEKTGLVLGDTSAAGNSLDGTISSGPTWDQSGGVTGALGDYSIDFEGSPDQVEITGNPAKLQITGDQTISMWLKPSNIGAGRQNPYNKAYGGEGTITQETNRTLNYFYGTSGADSSPYQGFNTSSTITQGVWNHVAIVRDLTNMKLHWYINGALVRTANATYSAAVAGSANVLIGNGYAGNYRGNIDEVAVFNEALGAAIVKAIYNAGSPPDLADGSFATTALGSTWGSHYIAFDGDDWAFGDSNSGIGSSSFTISVWTRISGDTGGAFIKVGNGSTGVGIGVGGSGASGTFDVDGRQLIILYEMRRWIPTGVDLTVATWNHIVLAVNSSGYPTVFLNGSQIYSDTGSGPIAPSMNIGIGAASGGERALAADVDEAALFCSELLTADIEYLYSLGPSYSGLAYSETPVDGIKLREEVKTSIGMEKVFSDSILMSETVLVGINYTLSISDGLALSESTFDPSNTFVEEHVEGLSLSEQVQLYIDYKIVNSDSILMSDSTNKSLLKAIEEEIFMEELLLREHGKIPKEIIKMTGVFLKNKVGTGDTVIYTGTIEDVTTEYAGTIEEINIAYGGTIEDIIELTGVII